MEKWSFHESYIWGNTFPACKAKNQSPINIDTELVKECKTLCNFEVRYKNSTCFVKNSNNLINLKCSPGSYFLYENTPFELTDITIHTPSLHSLDGAKSEIEICLIHKLSNNANSSINGIVLSRLFDKGPNFGKTETFINQIINDIPIENIDYEKEIQVSDKWGANMILPEDNLSYFTYNGSLPYPPCTESYKWFIYEDIGTIGNTNVDTLKTYIGNNARPIQRLNNRNVFYVVVNNKTVKKEQKIYTSDNKYLKCIKDDVADQEVIPTEMVQTTAVVEDTGMDLNTLKRIKQFLLFGVVILIFINSFFVVKYLYKHFMFQKMLRVIAGELVVNQGVIDAWKKCEKTTFAGKKK